ncbi:MAG: hypothetical protein LBB88_11555 [Planctomycetaceae bacterium]|nr:hypothetical protein [Planctomycetaceae bacterium]
MNVKVSELTSNAKSQSRKSVNLGLHRVSRRLKIKKFITNFWRYKMKSFLSYTILGVFALIFSGCCGGNVTPSTPTEPEPPTGEYAYLTNETRPGGVEDVEIFVTDQPIRGVTYTFFPAGTGEYSNDAYYFGNMATSYWGYVTQWSDGSTTYSDGPYEGVDYDGNITHYTAEFNYTIFNGGSNRELVPTDVDSWLIGTDTSGHVPDDYEFRAFDDGEYHDFDGEYVLKGTAGNVDGNTIGNNDDDSESNDFNNLPEENDELPLSN